MTFAENGVADRVARRSHEICGQEVAIDSATPLDEAGPIAGGSSTLSSSSSRPEYFGGYGGGPVRAFGRMYGGAMSLDDVSTYTNLKILYILTKYDSDFHLVCILVGIWSSERKTIKIRLEVPAILICPPDKTLSLALALSFVLSFTHQIHLSIFTLLW